MLPDDPGKFRQDVQSPLKADILAYRGDFPMKIKSIDHVVLTTGNLEKCLTFYAGLLGMEHQEKNGRHALLFGAQKFNIHTRKGEFQPAAENPSEGSIDIDVDDYTGAGDAHSATASSPHVAAIETEGEDADE